MEHMPGFTLSVGLLKGNRGMSRDRLYRTEAIILKRTNLGEADRLVTLYTPYGGKHRVIAKGVRKPTSRKAGHLELFTHSQLLLAKGRTLDVITQAEMIGSFPELRENLSKTSYAYYVIELLDRFTGEGIENYPLFQLLRQTLSWLNNESQVGLITRFYELHLLELVGYQPQLFYCVHCNETIKPVTNYFNVGDGGVICPSCAQNWTSPVRPISVNSLKALRYLQTHSFDVCQCLQINSEIQEDLEHIMLGYITYYLERNLKSVEFIQHLKRPIKPFTHNSVTMPTSPTKEDS
jgi:DNA repair protein RecO (recombination protein O)